MIFGKAAIFISSAATRSLSCLLASKVVPKFPLSAKMNCKKCNAVCPKRTVQKNTANHGRQFYSCSNTATSCKFFVWADSKPSCLKQTRSLSSSSSTSSATSIPSENTLVAYTDGACLGNRNVLKTVCPSGWGVVVVAGGGNVGVDQDKGEVVAELFGPVVLDQSSPYFLGATVGSNNTAELSAIGEALLWCTRHIQNPGGKAAEHLVQRVVIRYDSEYAAKSVQGIFNGKKNVALIATVREHYAGLCRAAEEVSFVHVKGHSDSRWNNVADELAGRGAAGKVCMLGRYGTEDDSSAATTTALSETASAQVLSNTFPGVNILPLKPKVTASGEGSGSILTKRRIGVFGGTERRLRVLPDRRSMSSSSPIQVSEVVFLSSDSESESQGEELGEVKH